ncbi:MAG: hypothetical protein AB8F94_02300 [Saprospiraceae bacterium]
MNTYKIIKGTFHVRGYSPDGDSIRFAADNRDHWDFLEWKTTKDKKKVKKQLRIEAIDALETHYSDLRQPNAFAIAALERMLELINITEVDYNLLVTKITAANDGTPGYIATSHIDVFGRPISYVFPADADLEDGAEILAANLPFKQSINYILVKEGIVYPTFYTTTEPVAVDLFFQRTRYSRRSRRGIWAIDRSMGFKLWNVETIQRDVVIFPKLFRRFASFFSHRSDINTFMDFLKDNPDPIRLRNGTVTNLRSLMYKDGNKYGLLVEPEFFNFIPRG